MRKGKSVKNPIAFLCAVISTCCLFVLFVSILRLPEPPPGGISLKSRRAAKSGKLSRNFSTDLGVFGETMIALLPPDLVFTVFVPSHRAFERDLRLSSRDGFSEENSNNTHAIISRVLGFTAVPRDLSSSTQPIGKSLDCDSISGFILHASKDEEGMVVVNGVRSERVDVKKGEVVVHVMDGVVMDADFEQSVQPDDADR